MFRHRERERCWKQGCQLGMIVILTFKSSWIFSAIIWNSSFCGLDVDRCCDWPARDAVSGCRAWTYLSCFTILSMLRLLDTAKSQYRLFCAWPAGRRVVSQVWSVDTGVGKWKQHNLLLPMCIVWAAFHFLAVFSKKKILWKLWSWFSKIFHQRIFPDWKWSISKFQFWRQILDIYRQPLLNVLYILFPAF